MEIKPCKNSKKTGLYLFLYMFLTFGTRK